MIFLSPLVLHLWLLHFELKINKQFLKGNVFCMPLGVLEYLVKNRKCIYLHYKSTKNNKTKCHNQKLDHYRLLCCLLTFSFYLFYFGNWEKELKQHENSKEESAWGIAAHPCYFTTGSQAVPSNVKGALPMFTTLWLQSRQMKVALGEVPPSPYSFTVHMEGWFLRRESVGVLSV